MRKRLNIEKNFIAEISTNWQVGDLIVVSSRPGRGKTRFLLSIIQSETFQQTPVEFISINYDANVNKCYNGIHEVCSLKENKHTPLAIPFRVTQDIKNYLQDISKVKDIKYVFIDNIDLIGEPLSNILIQLKIMAQELSIIIITTIPLDNAGKYEHVRPSLSALKRKIPIIERFADFIYLIYRPIYYTATPKEASLAHIIIAKNKDGETGYFLACVIKTTLIFEDFDPYKVIDSFWFEGKDCLGDTSK